jgi:predicted methyltransferase
VRCEVLFTCALGGALALSCSKAEPDKASAGNAAETASGRANDQSLFDRDRQPEVLIRLLGLKPGMVVADIGAGTGLLTVHIARAVTPGGRVVATDIDATVLDRLHARMVAAGYDRLVENRLVKPTDPGLEAGRYDTILLAQVDQYLTDRVGWLTKARPALVKGGTLAIANRSHHRAAAVAAAEAAGFRLVSESNDIPGQFVALFEVKP